LEDIFFRFPRAKPNLGSYNQDRMLQRRVAKTAQNHANDMVNGPAVSGQLGIVGDGNDGYSNVIAAPTVPIKKDGGISPVTKPPAASPVLTPSPVVNPAPPTASTATAVPTASISGPSTATAGSSVSLSGSGSNGPITGYQWVVISGPNIPAFSGATAANFQFGPVVAGTYLIGLQVTNSTGWSAMVNKSITVTPATSTPAPTQQAQALNAVIAPIGTITLPSSGFILDGSGSTDPNTGGQIIQYNWTQISGPNTVGILSPSSSKTQVNNLVSGTYVFNLAISDTYGATGSAQVTVVVNPAPSTPMGASIKPLGAAIAPVSAITLPSSGFTLDGTGSTDPNSGGAINVYNWQQVSGPSDATIVSPNSPTTQVANLSPGTYVFSLSISDSLGATGSAQVTVNVYPAATSPATASPQPPTANAGVNQVLTLPTNSTNLDGSGSTDPQGSNLTFSWGLVSGPNVPSFSSTTAIQPLVSNLIAGTYVFQLTVFNTMGQDSTATVSVVVNAAATSSLGVPDAGTVPLDGGGGGPFGDGGGGGGDSSGDQSGAPPIPLTFWQKLEYVTRRDWWLLLIAAAATAYVIWGPEDKPGKE
jgi:hypothetical protein